MNHHDISNFALVCGVGLIFLALLFAAEGLYNLAKRFQKRRQERRETLRRYEQTYPDFVAEMKRKGLL